MFGTNSGIHLHDTKTNEWNLMNINKEINAKTLNNNPICYDAIFKKLLITKSQNYLYSNIVIIDLKSAKTNDTGIYQICGPSIICGN